MIGLGLALTLRRQAARLNYKLGPFLFATPDAAPIASPHTEVGAVGSLTVTDTGSKLSIASDLIKWATRQGNNDPRVISTATLARAAGLAFHTYAKDTTWFAGFSTANNVSPTFGAFLCSSTSILPTPSNASNVSIGFARAVASYYNFITLLQSDGAHWFVKNAPGGIDYPYWTHLYFSTADATANLYAGFGAGSGNPSIEAAFERISVVQLAGGLNVDYSFATSYSASASAGATAVMSANGDVHCRWACVTNDVFELSVRRTDDDNRWIVRCSQAGSTIKLIQVEDSVETERSSAAQTFSNGTTYRINVTCVDFSIRTLVNDLLKTNYGSAVFNVAATGVKVSHAVTKLAAFSLILTGAAAAQLDRLAAPYVGAEPVAGSGELPAQGYIDRVLALSPDAYWTTQELYGLVALDATGNSRTGVFDAADGIAPNASGKYGTAYSWSNALTGHIDASAALTSAFTPNEFTVAFWLNMTHVLGQNTKFMECWNSALTQYFAIEARGGPGVPGDSIGIYLREAEGDQHIVAIQTIPGDTWCHFAFFNSLSTGTVGIYWNGVKYETVKTSVLGITGGVNYSTHPYILEALLGRAQHVAFWNRKLSQVEDRHDMYMTAASETFVAWTDLCGVWSRP